MRRDKEREQAEQKTVEEETRNPEFIRQMRTTESERAQLRICKFLYTLFPGTPVHLNTISTCMGSIQLCCN